MKKFFSLFLFFTSLFFLTSNAHGTDPLHYSLNTNLSSTSADFFTLSVKQQIDFDCQIDSICPINQTPQAVTLTFRRIQGEVTYNDKKHFFDTDQEELYSLEFQCLKKLLNEPITISLNNEIKIKEEVKDFNHLLSLSTLNNDFVNQDLLDQIIEALFFPIQATKKEKLPRLSLYFPFKTEILLTADLKEGKENINLNLNENLNLEGLYSTHQEPFSVHLLGKLLGRANWENKNLYCSELSFSHKLKEKTNETLFENPLTFEYSLSLKLKN